PFSSVKTRVEADLGITVEDYTQPPQGDSLCRRAAFDVGCPPCLDHERFLAVSAEDWCIKELEQEFYAREMRSDVPGGGYVNDGYASRALTGSMDFDSLDWKRFSNLKLAILAPPTDTPRDLTLRVGVCHSPTDPYTNSPCTILWFGLSSKTLRCPVPENSYFWSFMAENRYVMFDLYTDEVTGGAFCLSRLEGAGGGRPKTYGPLAWTPPRACGCRRRRCQGLRRSRPHRWPGPTRRIPRTGSRRSSQGSTRKCGAGSR